MNRPLSPSIRAVYMRGGASKGLFLHEQDLPRRPELRDALLLRLMGNPDPQGLQSDGLGGARSGTSKLAIIAPSRRGDCDVDYLHGDVAPDAAQIDWSGHCAQLSAAVGPFAIHEGLVRPADGIARVRIWQRNLGRRIDALVPVQQGQVLESGQFADEGVAFRGAEIRLEFHQPGPDEVAPLLPTGEPSQVLMVPGLGALRVSIIDAGGPVVFLRADSLALDGTELPERFNRAHGKLRLLSAIRAQAAVLLGLAASASQAQDLLPSVPRLCWVAAPKSYRLGRGREVSADQVDVLARFLSMGRLQDGFAAEQAIAVAAAAALPGTLVNEITRTLPGVATRIGHVSGTLAVGAEVSTLQGRWHLDKAVVSRSARRLMGGQVYWPDDVPGLLPGHF